MKPTDATAPTRPMTSHLGPLASRRLVPVRRAGEMPALPGTETHREARSPVPLSRRAMLARSAGALAGTFFAPDILIAALRPESANGYVVGEPGVEAIGAKILAEGGNAFDALVATALAGAIMQPHQTGIGGYAAHGMIAHDGGKRITALDANSTAPAAMREDIFRPGADGKVPGRVNEHGWLATGVPGLIAGMHLVAKEFGTRPFSEALRPSIKLLRDGFPFASGSHLFTLGDNTT